MQAFIKYTDESLTVTEETIDLAEAKLPRLYLCWDEENKYKGKFETYYSFELFLLGKVEQQTNFVSLNGDTNITYEELLDSVFPDLGSNYMGWDINGKTETLQDHFTVFSGNCKVLDISKYLDGDILLLKDWMDREYHVYLADPDVGLYHTINSESFEFTTTKKAVFLEIRLEEIHRLGKNKDCMLYGREQPFESYASCVENELGKVFEPILGCQVPWLAAGPNQVNRCKGKILLTDEKMKIFTKIVKNLRIKSEMNTKDSMPSCPRPCKEVNPIQALKKMKDGKPEIALVFNRTVKVKKYVLAYTVFDLVVEVGSSLGLWIGLSALGVFDLLLEVYGLCFVMVKKFM